jgi:hypothetical protein
MATEDVRVENGRIKVDRVETKESIDVAVSDVESVSYTRGAMGYTGALVLHTEDCDYIIRVETADAGKVLQSLQPKSEVTKTHKPVAHKTTPTE